MTLNIDKNTFVIFDLDDTLYKEVEYLKSAYRFISTIIFKEIRIDIYSEMYSLWKEKKPVFDIIKAKYSINQTIQELVELYRFHIPMIEVDKGAKLLLDKLVKNDVPIGLITDGRSRSQRNKLNSLKIEKYFKEVLISQEFGSEKPDQRNFLYYSKKYKNYKFIYIGDNFSKDFITPNKLGWMTIGLIDNGINIHSQNILLDKNYHPKIKINSFNDLNIKFN